MKKIRIILLGIVLVAGLVAIPSGSQAVGLSVSAITLSTTNINESLDGQIFHVTFDYSFYGGGSMDTGVIPTVSFTPDIVASGTLTADPTCGGSPGDQGWLDENTYRICYTVSDVNEEQTIMAIDITDGKDLDGTTQTPYSGGGEGLVVDTLAPTIGPVAIQDGDGTINFEESQSGVDINVTTAGAEDGQDATCSVADSGAGSVGPLTGAVSGGSATMNTGSLGSLSDGTVTATCSVTDAAGNVSATDSSTSTLDTFAPSFDSVSFNDNDGYVNAEESFSGVDIDVAITGSEDGQEVSCVITGGEAGSVGPVTGTVSSGSATIASGNISSLPDGNITAECSVSDAAGNGPATSTDTSTKDTVSPVISETNPVAPDPTADNTPSYGFTSDSDGTISYSGGCASATTDATIGLNTINFDTLSDGTYDGCKIYVADSIGNESNTIDVAPFTVDATGPAAPTADPDGGTYMYAQLVTLSAPGDPDTDPTIYYTLDGTDPDDTSWNVTGPITISGEYGDTVTLKAVVYDTLGNKGEIMTEEYTFDKDGEASDKMQAAFLVGDIGAEGNDPTNTTEITFFVDFTLDAGDATVFFPEGTVMTRTGGGTMDMSNMVMEDISVDLGAAGAIRIGMPNIRLSFSPAITVTIPVGDSYNGQTLTVYFQNEGEADWTAQTTCLVSDGNCVFQTDHATKYKTDDDTDDDSDGDDEEDYDKPKVDSWTASMFLDMSSCPVKLKLDIQGHDFDDDARVKIGGIKADSVDVHSSRKLTAKFCMAELLKPKIGPLRDIRVTNPHTDSSRAHKKIDLNNIVDASNFDPGTPQGVRNIQNALVKLGFLESQYVTGAFGPNTTEAVKKFQAANGLPETGFVGPLTQAKLKEKMD